MKILFLSQRVPYPPNKGEKIRTFHQIEYLLNNGNEVFLCCPYTLDYELDSIVEYTQDFGINIEKARLDNVCVRYLTGVISFLPLSVSYFYSYKLQKYIDRLLIEESFQTVICTSSSMAQYIFRSACYRDLVKKPKLLMDFMDLDSDKWSQYSLSSKFPKKLIYQREAYLLSRYEQKICNAFDVCFFISQAEVELFVKKNDCAKLPLAIGNGIDTSFFIPSSNPPANDHPVFIFTGVMDYKPNIDAVIWFVESIWPKVLSEFEHSRFIVAGMNPVPAITALTKIQGIEVTGFVANILPYYHQADIFVAPLRIARGVQNKILQAFSCGIPVVATSLGAEGIECTDGVDILIADTPDLFFEKIEKLKTNPEMYKAIKENALNLARNDYSWEGRLEILREIIK